MESSTRYKILSKVEETRDFLRELQNKKEQEDDNDSLSEVYKFKKALDWVEQYAQRSKEDESLDMTNFNQEIEELSKEEKKLKEAQLSTYQNNAETMILDKVLTTEIHYLKYKKEDMFFSRIEKISNTSKQLDNGILKVLAKCIDEKYSQNYKNTGERLIDDYTQIQLTEKYKLNLDCVLKEISELKFICKDFIEETQQVPKEDRDYELLKLIDATREEFNSVGNSGYDASVVYKLRNLAEELEGQRVRGEINFDDVQTQKINLIWRMRRTIKDISNLKNEILISETIENINKTKEQLGIMKIMGVDVELIELYSAFTNAHLDNLLNTTEQIHYENKDKLLQEINNIKTKNTEFQQEVKQQRNQEQ